MRRATTKGKPSRKSEEEELGIRPVALLDKPRSWAIYGRSGSGKTTFAASFPKPILLLDVRDQGTDSVADHDDLDVKTIDSWEEFEEIYYYLKSHPKKYKTVVIDTITQLQQVALEDVTASKKKGEDARIGDWGTLTKREWGAASGMMKDWIINFRNLPLEVVFLAQERVTSGDDESDNPDNLIVPEVGAHVMASVRIALNAAVSVIANSFIQLHRYQKEVRGKKVKKEEIRYCLRIGPNPIFDTKIRKPKTVQPPAWVEDPSYADIIEIIKGD